MTRHPALHRTSTIVAVAVLLIAGVLAWLAARVTNDANRDLLDRQVEQAATVLSSGVGSLQVQLADAGQVAIATDAAPGPFRRFAAARITSNESFAALSLLRSTDGEVELLATEGEDPRLPAGGLDDPFFTGLDTDGQLAVAGLLPGEQPRLAYALTPARDTTGLIVYAETLVNPEPQPEAEEPEDAAFGGLDFAVYLGDSIDPAQLILSTAPTPIRGDTETATTPFGDTVLTIVGSAQSPLTGGLATALPWIVGGLGATLAVASAAGVETLSRRRGVAEELAAENGRLYRQQRGIAGTLQHSLLPDLPPLDELEVAARYVAGVDDLDVGGDWYDVIPRGPGCYVFVVGDISGRGLPAATTMAALRFAVRAYVAEGHDIETVMAQLDRLLHVDTDHQFATVLLAELDTTAHRLRVLCAGHFPPLLVTAGRAEPIDCPITPPIGVGVPRTVAATVVHLPEAATLLAYTDGLVERRDEVLDVGLDRLREAAADAADQPLGALVDHLMEHMTVDGGKDDTVLMGLRWTR
ncbi:PP2C family protein-serine/threonine phosphatase [Blastococcus sp. VKM Ac-2987]|uniref:PP2C family protein-serine/threonine phosphatase n=1 Tax=Blastococcus sp. VKM Ac-2987 TaxID=3004141 RepID=UPI0022AB4EEE|nr:PP2C family protein-serine/threonine phosphatase [Blastococcus sp. VKM Ac-2987]MCZ2860872.1 PP2C family protein-serine/threonine phosphatase [Blastococcus sp. VKM Ac-2987]